MILSPFLWAVPVLFLLSVHTYGQYRKVLQLFFKYLQNSSGYMEHSLAQIKSMVRNVASCYDFSNNIDVFSGTSLA